MKVNGTGPNSADRTRGISGTGVADAVGNTKERRRPSRAPAVETGVADRVAISSRAKDAAKAKEIASGAPDVDEARVAKLKAAIQNGSYQVDADKVADRLVDEHLSTAF